MLSDRSALLTATTTAAMQYTTLQRRGWQLLVATTMCCHCGHGHFFTFITHHSACTIHRHPRHCQSRRVAAAALLNYVLRRSKTAPCTHHRAPRARPCAQGCRALTSSLHCHAPACPSTGPAASNRPGADYSPWLTSPTAANHCQSPPVSGGSPASSHFAQAGRCFKRQTLV